MSNTEAIATQDGHTIHYIDPFVSHMDQKEN